MLLLTRKQNESFLLEIDGLDAPIEIKVVEIAGQVKLGVTAPKNCKIWREELYQIVKANRQSSSCAQQSMRKLAQKIIGQLKES